jgi:hypothetical protein
MDSSVFPSSRVAHSGMAEHGDFEIEAPISQAMDSFLAAARRLSLKASAETSFMDTDETPHRKGDPPNGRA